MRKNKKKFEGSVQSATRGEWLRARQVALIVARLPKERSLISCSHQTLDHLMESGAHSQPGKQGAYAHKLI